MIPDYGGASVNGIVPALLGPSGWSSGVPPWMPAMIADARQVCLLILDGLGWDQLQAHASVVPTLASMEASRLTTVAPTTTATALCSITTGLMPGEHGLVGYRMVLGHEVLNVLRWTVAGDDRRRQYRPDDVQRFPAFLGHDVPVVSPAELGGTPFSTAHLRGSRHVGWRAVSSLPVEVGREIAAGERLVYAYYGGVDKIAHERGFGPFYDAELRTADRLVGDLLEILPPDAVLLVTADHGQVSVGGNIVHPSPDLLRHVAKQSGEGRFRWLHARRGAAPDLLSACHDEFDATGWVLDREELIDRGIFGPVVAPDVRRRLGDVAVLARDDVSYDDPDDTGPFELICRHGSLTAAEVYVPLLAANGVHP